VSATSDAQTPAGAITPPIPHDSRARHLGRRAAAVRNRIAGYSRFVNLMKVLLPAVAVVLVILIGAWPHLQTKDDRFRIGFSALKDRDTEDPAMINARFMGTDKNAQPFAITADLAKNLVKGTAKVELEMPKADMMLDDGTWLVLTAETGIYSRETRTLELVGAVNLFHDSGYEIRTAKARIDFIQGAASGTDPVRGHGPFGELVAEGFDLENKGKIIHFTGKSKLVLFPGIDGDE
jgi:lipopolysaccharide export system protein LptC